MATLNEHTSVLAEILSDISNQSDTNFIYILLTNKNEWQKEHIKTNKTQTKSKSVYKQTHVSRN